jgi:glycolate oxidase
MSVLSKKNPIGEKPGLGPRLKGLMDELKGIVGEGFVLSSMADLIVYEADANPYTQGVPELIVLPGSEAEAACVLRVVQGAGVPIVPRGAGTGLAGGAVANKGGVVVSLARMDRILEVNLLGRYVRVEPGVVNSRLQERLGRLGLYFAPDPSSQIACSLGGNAATNAGGPHCFKYGVTTEHTLGLRLLMLDGEAIEVDGLLEEPFLPGLLGLIVGSEGTLGLITELKLKVCDAPPLARTFLVGFKDVSLAMGAVEAIVAAGLVPAALEGMDSVILGALSKAMPDLGYPSPELAQAVLLVEFDGFLAEALDADMELGLEILGRFRPSFIKEALDPLERARLWRGRKGATASLGVYGPYRYMMDVVVPRPRLTEAIQGIQGIKERVGLTIGTVYHAGDGNMHPNLLIDPEDPLQLKALHEVSQRIMGLCVELGGVIAGEHGIGYEKEPFMTLMYTAGELEAFRGLRRAFDPKLLMNPGKVVA